MSLSPTQQTALEGASARGVYFVEFRFRSATSRVCTANQVITWGGYDWSGLAALGEIGAVQESDSLDAKPLDFSLNAAKLEWLAVAIGSVEEYRGRDVVMYFCPLDDQFRLVGTPQRCWSGTMQTVTSTTDGEQGKIILRCEGSAYGLKRRAPMRLNAAQHKQRHPGDTGLDYLADLIANPTTWLSVNFQRQ